MASRDIISELKCVYNHAREEEERTEEIMICAYACSAWGTIIDIERKSKDMQGLSRRKYTRRVDVEKEQSMLLAS